MNIRTRLYFGIGALALAAGAVTVAPAAHAGVSPIAQYTNASVNPVSGYYANNLGTYFTHIYSYIGSNASDSLQNLQAGAQNGAGAGLCDANPGSTGFGDALQVGAILNSDNTISVVYGGGRFNPNWTGVTNHNPCQNGSTGDPRKFGTTSDVLTAATVPVTFSSLSHIAASDTIVVQILESPIHHFGNGCNPGQVLFEAQDLNTGAGWESSPCLSYSMLDQGGTPQYSEADAGVIADTAGLVAPANRLLAVFAHVGLTGAHGHHGSFQADPNWTVHPVFSTHNANPSGLVYLAPNAFSHDHFNEDSGTPIG